MPEDATVAEFRPRDAGLAGLNEIAGAFLGLTVPGGQGVTTKAPEAAFLEAAARRAGSLDAACAGLVTALADPAAQDRPLVRAAAALGLGLAETAALAIARMVETDALAGRAVAYLQAPLGGARPTLGLLAAALAPLDPAPGLAVRLAAGAAVRSGLMGLSGNGPLPERGLWLADGMIAALSGSPVFWPGLTLLDTPASGDWPPSLVEALAPLLAGLANGGKQLLVVRGAAPLDRNEILTRIASHLGLSPALADLEAIETKGFGPLCVAAGLLPAFEVSAGPGEYRALPEMPGHDGPMLAFIGPEGQTGRAGLRPVEWTPPIPTADERRRLWRTAFPDGGVARHLGAEHLQSAGRIRELCLSAQAEARMTGKQAPDAVSLRAALWSAEGEGLGALAQPVRDQIPDAALVVAANLQGELALLHARCRHRERLTEGLGAAMTARYKVGVRGLFTGPSGTGKTMAASWLAGKLNLALYRVDLSAVSSKYIGETEKNLAKLLARAEEQEVVLLFDEADSLFGKRTDISDSNDRFANAQTNYLLQRIETYTGIVLLTSNTRNRFDEAFTRRIDVMVDFTQPQPAERRALWLVHLGSGHRVAETDLNRLAAMADLAGGHIRNVVLTAAVLAQEQGAPIAYGDLAEGLKVEYRKLGWTVPPELQAPGGEQP